MKSLVKNYKDLKAYQRFYQIYLDIYKIKKGFPKEEKYGMISRMKISTGILESSMNYPAASCEVSNTETTIFVILRLDRRIQKIRNWILYES